MFKRENDQFSNNFNYPKTTMHFNWANQNSKQINAHANNYNQVRGRAQWNNVPIIFLGFTNTSKCLGNIFSSNNKSCFQEIQRTEQQLDCGIIVSRVSVFTLLFTFSVFTWQRWRKTCNFWSFALAIYLNINSGFSHVSTITGKRLSFSKR